MVERRQKVSPTPPRESPPALEPHDVVRKHVAAERKIFGVGRTQLDEGIRRGEIPKPVKFGPRAAGWFGSQILAWQAERLAAAERGED
jgi:predicted DNA-binding transcriptional regulator AlpA